MKVRAKLKEEELTRQFDDQLSLDAHQHLNVGYLGNRVRRFQEACHNSRDVTLDQFLSFLPLACYECRRERTADQLRVAIDFFIRCVDRDDCKQYWHGPPKELAGEKESVSGKDSAPVLDGGAATNQPRSPASRAKKPNHKWKVKK